MIAFESALGNLCSPRSFVDLRIIVKYDFDNRTIIISKVI